MQARCVTEDDESRVGALWPEYASTMLICFSGWENGAACGELWSFYFEESLPFYSLDQILFGIETIMDNAGYPQKWCERRSLVTVPRRGKSSVTRAPYVPPPEHRVPYYKPDSFCTMRGSLCTVSIRVHCRQNASIQGVLNLSRGQKIYFRSALELLYLLKEVLDAAQLQRRERSKRE